MNQIKFLYPLTGGGICPDRRGLIAFNTHDIALESRGDV